MAETNEIDALIEQGFVIYKVSVMDFTVERTGVSIRGSLKCHQSGVTIFVKNSYKETPMAQKVVRKKNAVRW